MKPVRLEILKAGVELWERGEQPTASAIAKALGLAAHASVLYHFKGAADLAASLARYAVESGNSRVIVQMIATEHPAVADMDHDRKRYHLAIISGTSER